MASEVSRERTREQEAAMGGGRSHVSFRVQFLRESSQLPCSRATIQLPRAYPA